MLDPSKEALTQAHDQFLPFINKGKSYNIKLQDISLPLSDTFDLIWIMHGFYAIPRIDLKRSIDHLLEMLSDNGTCFIAQAGRNSFYIDFYNQYSKYFNIRNSSFTSAEDILEILVKMGVTYHVQTFNYNECIDKNDNDSVNHYLFHECIDNSFKPNNKNKKLTLKNLQFLSQIKKDRHFAQQYLDNYIQNEYYSFPQNVCLCLIKK
ncbi:MAG: hypothetical protein OMM_02765 [Candidatus Magnetoglobus multicellularis str. Araruama]|uniref:Methyltransferase type 11 domain-containing protein n=1 Tax=Candidatus Magnetoglobus multicellularis str. Araruama TaxID=890399 RepID=A0A1V1P8E8_9BACT|nr:MAG: hypothetical protein OMM_02765 [Candidatus Magnetoglobus multicellularis str. Araruama]